MGRHTLHRTGRARLGLLALATLGAFALPAVAESPRLLPSRASAAALHQPRPVFRVERDGALVGHFRSVDGLGSETEVIEVREGGDSMGIIRKIPGRTKFLDVTLKRGITRNLDLWTWRDEVVKDTLQRSTVVVALLGRGGAIMARWQFVNAWPSKITAPELDADGNDVAVEELTLAHEGMMRVE